MKNILVLGGTGAMGKHLVEILAIEGHQVTVTTRADRKASENIHYVKGNAQNARFLDRLLSQRWDAIVDFMVYPTPNFQQRASKLLISTDQYIFLSSARVYSNSDAEINENSSRLLDVVPDKNFLATDDYSLAKARQENILIQSSQTNWTVIRPYITYDSQRLQLGILEKEDWLFRAIKGRTIVFSEDIAERLTTLTHGGDVAKTISALIGQPLAFGNIFNVTQTTAVRWREILDIYLRVLERKLGQRPKVMLLDLGLFSQCKCAQHQIRYDRMFDRVFDNKKITTVVDVQSFLPIEEGLTECLETFLKEPSFLKIDGRSQGIMDRFTDEKTKLHELPGWKQKVKYLLYRYIKI